MVFSSSIFLFLFLPVVLFVYYFCHDRVKNGWLLFASLFFYSWGEPKHILLMLSSIVINYFLGIGMEQSKEKSIKRKSLLLITCVIDLGILLVFKYLDFGIQTINTVFHTNFLLKELALPVGISFYTFQVMSYCIDVYRGTVKAQRNILNLGLYISLFPQLIAGPIVRYIDVEVTLTKRTYGLEYLYLGAKRFMIGFSKKVLIADNLSTVADLAFDTSISSMPLAWIGILAYSLQIYYDFSGYSDMAIGLGSMFGFEFKENFNYPYTAKSIREFWRRWHISLSTWFREYVYIPLGGNRKGVVRTYLNLFLVFLLTGFWHGASLTFLFWGVFHGCFMIIERLGFQKILENNPLKFLNRIYVWLVVICGWVFFRMDGMRKGLSFLKAMFVYQKGEYNLFTCLNAEAVLVLVFGILFCGMLQNGLPKLKQALYRKEDISAAQMGCLFVIFLLCICSLAADSYNPFIYFRF